MIRKYREEYDKDHDKGLSYLLFAVRKTLNESQIFAPFEQTFTYAVKGPMKLVRDKLLGKDDEVGLLQFVTEVNEMLSESWKIAGENLTKEQNKQKIWYDRKARSRHFNPDDEVLLLLPVQGLPLSAKFAGPYIFVKKVSDVNYVIATPDRRKKGKDVSYLLVKRISTQ